MLEKIFTFSSILFFLPISLTLQHTAFSPLNFTLKFVAKGADLVYEGLDTFEQGSA